MQRSSLSSTPRLRPCRKRWAARPCVCAVHHRRGSPPLLTPCPHALPHTTQVDEVKNIMSDNIEKVLSRGEKLDLLVDKTELLQVFVWCAWVGLALHGVVSAPQGWCLWCWCLDAIHALCQS